MNQEQLSEGRKMLREWGALHPDQKKLLQGIPPGSTPGDRATEASLEGVWIATRRELGGQPEPLTHQGIPLQLVIERGRLASAS